MISISFLFEAEEDFWTKIYKNNEAHWMDKKVSNLAKKSVLKYTSFINVLEVGCAAGIDTFYLAKFTKNKIIGIDLVQQAITEAEKNLTLQPKDIQNKVIFEVGNVEDLKYSDDSFDFIYSLSVIHSTDYKKSLKELRRVATNDANIVIYIYLNEEEHLVDEKDFVDICEEYFTIDKKEYHEIEEDSGGDIHKALILFMKSK